jgi:hypothetical protein
MKESYKLHEKEIDMNVLRHHFQCDDVNYDSNVWKFFKRKIWYRAQQSVAHKSVVGDSQSDSAAVSQSA